VKKEKDTPKDAGLRSRAEEKLAGKKREPIHLLAEEEARRMVHELQVHQIELELQNEELMQAREEIEKQFEKYSDLYNFAPVGYFTLDEHGTILEANLTGAKLLNTTRSEMKGRRFSSFLSSECRPGFDTCVMAAFKGTAAEACEVALPGVPLRYLQIEVTAVRSGEGTSRQCRLAAMDVTGRKLAEEALHESDTRLKLALSSSHTGVWTWNAATNGVFWSDECYEIVGTKEFGGTFESFTSLLHPEDAPGVMAKIAQVSMNQPPFEAEFRIVRPDGGVRWLTGSGQGYFDRDGTLLRIVGTVQDITGRKQAEKKLRASEERHRSFIEVTGELGWTTNSHGEVVEDLPTWRSFTGQSAEEIMGAGWTSALHPDDVAQTMHAWKNAVTTKGPYEVEYRIRRHDGIYRHFLARGVPVFNQDGTIREWIGTCIDITERKASERILRRYELLSQHSRDIVLFMRRDDGKILEANTAATNAYGYSREELLQLTINDLRASDTLGLTDGQMAQADAQGILFETVHRCKDGSTFAAEVSSRGATIDGIRMLISVVRDCTERDLLYRALRQAHDGLELRVQERTAELEKAYAALRVETEQRQGAERQLRQAQKIESLGLLAGGIAHDFNNILAAVLGFAELAQDETPEGSPARSHMEKVFTAGMRGRDLVKQILTFSRQAEQERRPLQLTQVIKETLQLLRPALPATVEIRTNLQNESGFVLADLGQMQQVILNLCTNAAHAMRQTGGRISIDLSGYSFSSRKDAPDPTMSPGPYVRFRVSDTGEGMSPEVLERVFDPFFTTKPQEEGTGLGLSVVHGIIASHGGAITVSSKPGKGSSFTVYLPKYHEDGARDSAQDDGAIPQGHERVLFVDDEKDAAVIGDKMLTGLGYHVISKTGSREALALFRLNPSAFDVVVTDQTMPGLTGLELAKEILALRPDMPIIMCTGFSHVVDAHSAKAAGIRAFTMKPLIKKEIAQTIRGVLDKES